MRAKENLKQASFGLPGDLIRRIEEEAARDHRSRSAVVRMALERALPPPKRGKQ